MADHFVSIFSDNDPFVPVGDNRKVVEERLGSKVILLNNKGHLNEDAGVKEIPEILDFL
jgi:predicted alpha/beta hydrolase family esterase